jgi:urease subunit alpha
VTDTSAPRAISRQEYAKLFGPTTGDKIRLGDTDLYIEIEKDLRVYGDEALYGGGKTLRDGMAIDNQLTSVSGALDLVITNVVLVDPLLGVIKAAASTPTSTSSRRSRLWRRSATA